MEYINNDDPNALDEDGVPRYFWNEINDKRGTYQERMLALLDKFDEETVSDRFLNDDQRSTRNELSSTLRGMVENVPGVGFFRERNMANFEHIIGVPSSEWSYDFESQVKNVEYLIKTFEELGLKSKEHKM